MKQLSWKLVLPLTIISFFGITKWWYVAVVDGWDVMMTGFPLPYSCPGFHTSLSYQIFIVELIIDLLFYFTFWFLLIFVINRFIKQIKLNKGLTIVLTLIAGFLASGMIFIAALPDNIFIIKRDFEYEVLDSGLDLWQTQKRPEYNDYLPENQD